jgi:DNA-binding PadR family transcriptional regulator
LNPVQNRSEVNAIIWIVVVMKGKNCMCRCGPFKINLIPPGILKPLILNILMEKPMHGYEIMNEISRRTDGFWRPTAGSIYPALNSLVKDGYVERNEMSQGQRVRQVYVLTDAGKMAIKDIGLLSSDWMAGLDKIYRLW